MLLSETSNNEQLRSGARQLDDFIALAGGAEIVEGFKEIGLIDLSGARLKNESLFVLS